MSDEAPAEPLIRDLSPEDDFSDLVRVVFARAVAEIVSHQLGNEVTADAILSLVDGGLVSTASGLADAASDVRDFLAVEAASDEASLTGASDAAQVDTTDGAP